MVTFSTAVCAPRYAPPGDSTNSAACRTRVGGHTAPSDGTTRPAAQRGSGAAGQKQPRRAGTRPAGGRPPSGGSEESAVAVPPEGRLANGKIARAGGGGAWVLRA